jgi:hypothetical protein
MLILSTVDDWTAAAVVFDDGSASATFAPSDVDNIFDALEQLRVWLAATFAATSTVGFVKQPASRGLVVDVDTSLSFTYTPNTDAIALFGISAHSTPSTSFLGTAPAAGTWAPASLVMAGYTLTRAFDGVASVTGVAGQSTAGRRPTLAAISDALGAARFQGIASRSNSPRIGFALSGGTWRRLSVGKVTRTKTTPSLYSFAIEVRA